MFRIKQFIVGYLQTNCYIVNDENNVAVVIDPGGGYEKISAYISENNLDLKAVLLTHGHFDHILALPSLVRDGAKVYIHEKDVGKLNNEGNLLDMFHLYPMDPVSADVLLHDGDRLKIGEMSFEVLYTPGHTEGSVCYLLDKTVLFSGDTLFDGTYGRTDFPDGDVEKMKKSLRRLFTLDPEIKVCPGHDEETTIGREQSGNAIWDLL